MTMSKLHRNALRGTIFACWFAFGALNVLAQNLNITTSSPLPDAFTGIAYSQTFTASGGTGTRTWTIRSGSVPSGLSLSTSGVLSGTPTNAGESNFKIRVATASQSDEMDFRLTVFVPLIITTSSPLPNATQGSAYSQSMTVTGGKTPYEWSILSGALPAGLQLSKGGSLSGTPTGTGTFNFNVKVQDKDDQTAQTAMTLVVLPMTITTGSALPSGTLGTTYSQTFAVSGGRSPYSWSIATGSLPAGLTLSGGGILSGTLTAAGSSNFTIRVTDNSSPALTAQKSFVLDVVGPLSITTASPLPPGTPGVGYSLTLSASGGTAPYSWSLASGSLPAGLSLTGATIAGTPTGMGTSSFTVQVTDSSSPAFSSQKVLFLDIAVPLIITTPSPLPSGTTGTGYSHNLSAAGGVAPYSWSMASGALPAGLSLSSTGVISGTPSTPGTANFSARVFDSSSPPQNFSKAFTLTIAGSLTITSTSLPSGVAGSSYSRTMTVTGGTAPYNWSVTTGSLPAGLTLNGPTISGTPTTAGSSTFTLRVTDSSSPSLSAEIGLTIVVSAGGPVSILLTGVPTKLSPMQQIPIAVSLPASNPAELQGTLDLTFTSTSIVPADDPAVQFSTGGRSVKFTIPANTTSAVFVSPVLLAAGTVAGTVSITGSIQNGPSGLALASATVEATPPQITDLTATRISGGLKVHVVGFSPERRVLELGYSFEVRVNGAIERVNLTRAVESDFNAWYRSSASSLFGSAFGLDQGFNVVGNTSAIEAVTITLRNAQGITTSARVPFTGN